MVLELNGMSFAQQEHNNKFQISNNLFHLFKYRLCIFLSLFDNKTYVTTKRGQHINR